MSIRDIRIRLPNLELAALRQCGDAHGGEDGRERPPLLMLHGWMDNAASFLPLLPYLTGFDAVALEHAGHGHSDHRPPGHWYHLMDYVADALAAVDALGWERFYLMGHSLGGAVATLMSVAAPGRVIALTTVEGLGPLAGSSHDICQRLQRSWQQLSNIDPARLRRYDSVEEALKARMTKNEIAAGPARALVERGLRRDGEHWIWRSDPRLNITTPYRFDETQITHLITGVECPCLAVLSDPPTPLLPVESFHRRVAALPRSRLASLPGGHHLHMNYPEQLAPIVLDHFQQSETAA